MPIIRWTRGAEGVNYHHKSANQTPDYKYITYTAKLFSWKIFLFAEEADTGEGILGAGEAASTDYLVRLIVCMSV